MEDVKAAVNEPRSFDQMLLDGGTMWIFLKPSVIFFHDSIDLSGRSIGRGRGRKRGVCTPLLISIK